MDRETIAQLIACKKSPLYFIVSYVQLENVIAGGWLPFELWPAQAQVLDLMVNKRLLVILKARQLGMTWLALAYALWTMLFAPSASVLLFSMRDNEATDLLDRLVRMYKRLPEWLQAKEIETEAGHDFRLSNGARAQAFPTSAGDSYTASLVIADEADLISDLNRFLAKAKPTIDAGAKLFLIGRVDKDTPFSPFKRIFRDSQDNPESQWTGIFLPWMARPERDRAWYEGVRKEILTRTGALDELYEQYPETIAQALSPRSLDKRLPPDWLQGSYREQKPLDIVGHDLWKLPGLSIYREPEQAMRYVIGVDPAEGNPGSDESAIEVMSSRGEEVAVLAGQIEPSLTAAYTEMLSQYYRNAPVLVERNNHGHAVIQWLKENTRVRLLQGHDRPVTQTRPKPGWLQNSKGKALMYSVLADGLKEAQVVIHNWKTFEQLSSIDGSTLSAPQGQHDDRATAFALAFLATQVPSGPVPQVEVNFRRS